MRDVLEALPIEDDDNNDFEQLDYNLEDVRAGVALFRRYLETCAVWRYSDEEVDACVEELQR